MTASEVGVSVLKGSKLKVDGKEIPQKYEIDSENEESSIVVLPRLFTGTHKIEVAKDGMDTLSRNVDIPGNNTTVYMEDMKLSKETADKLQKLSIDNMKKIYTAAANGEPFNKIIDIFVTDAERLSSIQEAYENLAGTFNSDNQIIKNFIISNIKTEITTDRSAVMKTFSYSLDYSKKYTFWFGSPEWRDGSNQGEQTSRSEFVNVDGKWLQTGLGCEAPYVSFY